MKVWKKLQSITNALDNQEQLTIFNRVCYIFLMPMGHATLTRVSNNTRLTRMGLLSFPLPLNDSVFMQGEKSAPPLSKKIEKTVFPSWKRRKLEKGSFSQLFVKYGNVQKYQSRKLSTEFTRFSGFKQLVEKVIIWHKIYKIHFTCI